MTLVARIGCAEQYDAEREGNAVHCGRCADWLKENAASFSSADALLKAETPSENRDLIGF